MCIVIVWVDNIGGGMCVSKFKMKDMNEEISRENDDLTSQLESTEIKKNNVQRTDAFHFRRIICAICFSEPPTIQIVLQNSLLVAKSIR